MIKTEMCELLGVKHPIIQAGMGPFSNNQLCIATANSGVLGLLSTSGLGTRKTNFKIFSHFAETGGANPDDDEATILKTILQQTYERTKESGGIFGVNVMVSAEMMPLANLIVDTAIEACEENPELKESGGTLRKIKHMQNILRNEGLSNKTMKENIDEFEDVPAFIRKKIKIDSDKRKDKSEVSKFTLSDDEDEPSLRDDNAYLNDNVD